MEKSPNHRRLMARTGVPLSAGALLGAMGLGAWAQDTSGKPESPPGPPPVARDCGEASVTVTPLPNSAVALQKRQQVKILAIGASSAAMLGMGHDGNPPLLEE